MVGECVGFLFTSWEGWLDQRVSAANGVSLAIFHNEWIIKIVVKRIVLKCILIRRTYVWTRFVKGSIIFLPKRGSKGHKAPNYKKVEVHVRDAALSLDAKQKFHGYPLTF